MIDINNAGGQALLVGGVAAWLTTMATGEDWLIKDYLFVVAVVVVVVVGSLRKAKYERLAQHERLLRGRFVWTLAFTWIRATKSDHLVLFDQPMTSRRSSSFMVIQSNWSRIKSPASCSS
ncbi:unnamed protein product [Phytophthora lilii]|uniref:Unnamed protein product n=1 Tax=Phytophthora lilii TaxID=2077276 RepID=A0A9W6WQ34_9STRA|nr:unnamed protein product [Phytophthora lilii]